MNNTVNCLLIIIKAFAKCFQWNSIKINKVQWAGKPHHISCHVAEAVETSHCELKQKATQEWHHSENGHVRARNGRRKGKCHPDLQRNEKNQGFINMKGMHVSCFINKTLLFRFFAGQDNIYPYNCHSWHERAHFRRDGSLGWLFALVYNGKFILWTEAKSHPRVTSLRKWARSCQEWQT